MLLHIEHVLDADTVTRMRAHLDAAEWTDGRETVGPQGALVKRNLQLPDASPLRAQLGREVLAACARHADFHAATLPVKILPPRFNRYADGGSYGAHVDGSVMALADGSQLRSDIACTVFLAEPDDYDGGELVVEDTYGEHEVKLAAGDAIVYPASSLHRVEPVTRGARLAAFFWVQSLVRDEAQRRTLLQLDSATRRLAAAAADADAVKQLAGVYHNLLRQWAET
ncbi:MAG TPA: Fe2+-dependent dioxygenase [Rhodanobacteraceae bacterium]|jgi:PKHD-type hydroxylase|nr:Fe2+-dependent dioxygenase [Rhodanobacteraceae bacterium]